MRRWLGWMALAWSAAGASWAGFQAAPLAVPPGPGGLPVAFELSMGVLNGGAKELVFDYETPTGARRELSRLEWDLKNVVMGGGRATVRVSERFTLNGGAWLALSKGGGEMEDFDWLEPGSRDWTHYSLSDVDVTMGYLLDANVAWDAFVREALVLRALAGYKQNGWEWEDHGKLMLYPNNGYIPVYLNGSTAVRYEQEFRMPYLGVQGAWQGGSWSVSGYVLYAPYVWADDWDDHIVRAISYHSSFDGGTMLAGGVEARFDVEQGPWSGVFFTAAADFQRIDRIVGDAELVYLPTGEWSGAKDVAGIDNTIALVSLGMGFQF